MLLNDKVAVGIIDNGNLMIFYIAKFIFLDPDNLCKRHDFLLCAVAVRLYTKRLLD